jgi:hypothetical protein
VVEAVAMGGVITFNCRPQPVTITMTQTANIVHGDLIVIDAADGPPSACPCVLSGTDSDERRH